MKTAIFIIDNDAKFFSRYKRLLEENFDCRVFPEDDDKFEKFLYENIQPYTETCKEKGNDAASVKKSDAYISLKKYIEGSGAMAHILVDVNLTLNDGLDGYGDNLYSFIKEDIEYASVKKFTANKLGNDYVTKHTVNARLIDEFRIKLNLDPKTGIPETKSDPKVTTFEKNSENQPEIVAMLLEKNKKLEEEIAVCKRKVFLSDWKTILANNTIAIIFLSYFLSGSTISINLDVLSIIGCFVLAALLVYVFIRWFHRSTIESKIIPYIQDSIHGWVSLFFLFFIIISIPATVGLTYYHFKVIHKINALIISENLFLIFLPFFIICSFYFFYTKSLVTVVTGKAEGKFDEGIKLMNIIKTFFVSSIISYLVVKLIEIIYDQEEKIKLALDKIHSQEIDSQSLQILSETIKDSYNYYNLFQAISYSSLIILLMLFYLKIKHHPQEH